MPLKLLITKDGSHTIEGDDGLTYHSTFGAIAESMHIFIERGLRAATHDGTLSIFEMGLGAGLNALLTLMEVAGTGRTIHYETVDSNPLPWSLVREINYCRQLGRPEYQEIFERVHSCDWGRPIALHPKFTFLKVKSDLRDHQLWRPAGLVYFDAFDPAAQPELWTADIFRRLFLASIPGAMLVTYSCKGAVRRTLESVGFKTEKLPGPPGKREILRAWVPRNS